MQHVARIIVIDDHPACRESLRWLLESLGCEAIGFGSAEEFLETLPQRDWQCLITDQRLPGISGADLLRELARRGHRGPQILLSAEPLSRAITDTIDWPHVTRLLKPVDADYLSAMISQLRLT